MFVLEKDIKAEFDKFRIAYDYAPADYILRSEKLIIQLIPNLHNPEFVVKELNAAQGHIRIWEDQYLQQPSIILSRVRSLLGLNQRINARETTIATISQSEFDLFVEKNHLNLSTKAKHRFALQLKGEVVAVAGFGRSCPIDYNSKTYKSNELIRFCSVQGVTIVGGLSKLLHHFIKSQDTEHIMTYIDKEWSTAKSFRRLGFEIIDITIPEIFAISPEDGKRYRLNELANFNNTKNWQKVSNLGNLKLVMLVERNSDEQ